MSNYIFACEFGLISCSIVVRSLFLFAFINSVFFFRCTFVIVNRVKVLKCEFQTVLGVSITCTSYI